MDGAWGFLEAPLELEQAQEVGSWEVAFRSSLPPLATTLLRADKQRSTTLVRSQVQFIVVSEYRLTFGMGEMRLVCLELWDA